MVKLLALLLLLLFMPETLLVAPFVLLIALRGVAEARSRTHCMNPPGVLKLERPGDAKSKVRFRVTLFGGNLCVLIFPGGEARVVDWEDDSEDLEDFDPELRLRASAYSLRELFS